VTQPHTHDARGAELEARLLGAAAARLHDAMLRHSVFAALETQLGDPQPGRSAMGARGGSWSVLLSSALGAVGTPDYPSGIPDMHTIHDPMISVS
jgi:hypothetical protein